MEESELTKGKAIVLNEKNLGEYRQWLKHVREKVRAEQGRLTESHLIGEVVPDSDASNDDVNISGEMSGQSNGADGKRRRRIRSLEEFEEGPERQAACIAYGELSLFSLGTKAVAAMSEAAIERAKTNQLLQMTAYHEREDYLNNLLNETTSGDVLDAMNLLGTEASAYERLKSIYEQHWKLSVERLEVLNNLWSSTSVELNGEAIQLQPGVSIMHFILNLDRLCQEIIKLTSPVDLDTVKTRCSDSEKERKVREEIIS